MKSMQKMSCHITNTKSRMLADDVFKYTASCPVCCKRVFDISDLIGVHVRVRLKCPHCRKIVEIPLASAES